MPESDSNEIAKENYFYFVLHNLRGKIRQISSDFLPIQHLRSKNTDDFDGNIFVSNLSTKEESGINIGWERSTSYRDQFITLIPIVLFGFLLLTLVIWRNINKISKLHSELSRREEQARFSASHDGMTGLANRQSFEAKVYFLLKNLLGKRKIFVGLLDLDKFKNVNDTYGHQTGDEMIKVTASRLSDIMGETNLAARLGGDEFAFAFSEESFDAAQIRMQTLLDRLKEDFEFNGVVLYPSASIGVCEAIEGYSDRDVLLNLADQALYEVKRNGRSGVTFYQHKSSNDNQDELSLIA